MGLVSIHDRFRRLCDVPCVCITDNMYCVLFSPGTASELKVRHQKSCWIRYHPCWLTGLAWLLANPTSHMVCRQRDGFQTSDRAKEHQKSCVCSGHRACFRSGRKQLRENCNFTWKAVCICCVLCVRSCAAHVKIGSTTFCQLTIVVNDAICSKISHAIKSRCSSDAFLFLCYNRFAGRKRQSWTRWKKKTTHTKQKMMKATAQGRPYRGWPIPRDQMPIIRSDLIQSDPILQPVPIPTVIWSKPPSESVQNKVAAKAVQQNKILFCLFLFNMHIIWHIIKNKMFDNPGYNILPLESQEKIIIYQM